MAKKCEQTREKQCSQWYYPAWGDEENTLLMEIVEKAKEYKGERLFDRYTLQMMRALFSLRQYNECLSIWLSRKNSFHRDVIEEMAKKLEVAKLTVFRHISDISTFYPIVTNRGYGGGVRLLPSADALTDEEIEYAVDALKEKSGEEKQVIIRKIRKLKKGIHNVGK